MSDWKPMSGDEFVKKALATIPKSPEDRVTDKVRKIRARKNYVYDVHVHAFDKQSINEAYFIFQFIRETIRRDTKAAFVQEDLSDQEFAAQQILQAANATSIEDFYDGTEIPEWDTIESAISSAEEFASFSPQKGVVGIESYSEFFWFVLRKFFKSKSQREILNFYFDKYSLANEVEQFKGKDMIVCLLMMDFHNEFGNRKPAKSMWRQVLEINELADLKNGHPILPFLALDPRRVNEKGKENLYELFLKAFDPAQGGRFFGVKLYPALGYSPSDPALLPFYEVCEKLNIPVVSHCGGEMVSTFKETIMIRENFDSSREVKVERNRNVRGNARKQRIFNLNDPSKFAPVFKEFPKIKINMAHFGADQAWIDKEENEEYGKRISAVTDLIEIYDGAFTDFSFNLMDSETYVKLNDVLRKNISNKVTDRIMYGTDYWVVLFNDKDRFADCLRHFSQSVLVDQIVERMVTTNPDSYLFDQLYSQ